MRLYLYSIGYNKATQSLSPEIRRTSKRTFGSVLGRGRAGQDATDQGPSQTANKVSFIVAFVSPTDRNSQPLCTRCLATALVSMTTHIVALGA